jgi:hypothetical protein
MKTEHHSKTWAIRWIVAIGLATVFAACSGGISGSGGGGVPAGSAAGPIDGFGSVIVNGVTFNTDSATFTVDGQPATQADMKVGQVIELRGDFDSRVANSIEYRSEIKGPVTAVTITDAGLGLGTLTVLGQEVLVSLQTVFDGTDLESLAPGDLLEVSGQRDYNDALHASFIEAKSSLAEYKLVGEVYTLDQVAGTFEIGGLVVSYFGADAGDMPTDVDTWLEAIVEVKGVPGDFDSIANTFLINKIEPVPGIMTTPGSTIEIEGYVAYLVGASGSFEVGNVSMVYTPDTVYINGSLDSISNNVRGVVDDDGTVLAEVCEILVTKAIRAEWNVEAVDVANSAVTVLGVQWEVRPESDLRDKSTLDLDPFNLSDLSVGDLVEVRGYMDGSTPVVARLERDDSQTDARLRGPVTSTAGVDSFRVELLGVEVLGDDLTVYRDFDNSPMSKQDFFDALSAGVFVEAKWDPFSSTTAAADELTLEND